MLYESRVSFDKNRFIGQVEFEETLGGMVEAMTEIQGRADGMMAEIRTREVSECWVEPLRGLSTVELLKEIQIVS